VFNDGRFKLLTGKFMHRHPGLRWLFTLIIALALGFTGWRIFHADQQFRVPFVRLADARTAIVQAEDGFPLPATLKPGDRIELPALAASARIALIKTANLNLLPGDAAYDLVVQHANTHDAPVAVTVHTVHFANKFAFRALSAWGLFSFVTYPLCLAIIALLSLWKGRTREASGLALWAFTFLLGLTLQFVPCDGIVGLAVLLTSNVLFLLARIGFYIMAEAITSPLLPPRARTIWRVVFLLVFGLGAIQSLAGPLIFVGYGWAELIRPAYGVMLTVSYTVPLAMLLAVWARASAVQRLRLRWMISCSAFYVMAIFLINTPIFGPMASPPIARVMISLSLTGLLYTVLRTRLLDFTVVLNRTLVYAATTSLVLGLFALFESQIERIAVGERTSLLLELIVPLALGASLTTVHRRIDALVERLVFRRQYRQEQALRRFAREAAFVTVPDKLLELTAVELRRHIGAPWVGLYESASPGYALVQQSGDHALPVQIDADDPTVIALRAHDPEVDLHDRAGLLRRDGYAFPLQVRGELLGLLVVGSRPQEHYSSEERELFALVAHEVGAALFAIRAHIGDEQLADARRREMILQEALETARVREIALLDMLRVGFQKQTG
jgi:hypothetical protein